MDDSTRIIKKGVRPEEVQAPLPESPNPPITRTLVVAEPQVAKPPADRPVEALYGRYLRAGALIESRYRVMGVAGRGGFATVYQAHKLDSRELVAIKVLDRASRHMGKAFGRFQREAVALRRLEHPNIVRIDGTGWLHDGRPYIAMEWLGEHTLRDEVRKRTRFSVRDAYAVLADIAHALGAAHEQGIVHRDLKPDNIMAMPRGEWFTIKLLDFGIARLLAPEDREHWMTSQTVLGTPTSMAPEQFRGLAIGERTDIYALGVLLFFLLTGRRPFQGESMLDVERAHLHAPPPRASDFVNAARAIDHVIAKAMAKRPERRYASADAFIDALHAALESSGSGGPDCAAPAGDEPSDKGSAPAGAEEYRALAVLVEVDLDGDASGSDAGDDDERDALIEDGLDRLAEALESAELSLVDSGAMTILGVRVLVDPRSASKVKSEVLATALGIARAWRLYWPGQTPPALAVAVHEGAVLAVRENGDVRPLDGDLLCLGTWPAVAPDHQPEAESVLISRVAAEGLTGSFTLDSVDEDALWCRAG